MYYRFVNNVLKAITLYQMLEIQPNVYHAANGEIHACNATQKMDAQTVVKLTGIWVVSALRNGSEE